MAAGGQTRRLGRIYVGAIGIAVERDADFDHRHDPVAGHVEVLTLPPDTDADHRLAAASRHVLTRLRLGHAGLGHATWRVIGEVDLGLGREKERRQCLTGRAADLGTRCLFGVDRHAPQVAGHQLGRLDARTQGQDIDRARATARGDRLRHLLDQHADTRRLLVLQGRPRARGPRTGERHGDLGCGHPAGVGQFGVRHQHLGARHARLGVALPPTGQILLQPYLDPVDPFLPHPTPLGTEDRIREYAGRANARLGCAEASPSGHHHRRGVDGGQERVALRWFRRRHRPTSAQRWSGGSWRR